MDQESGETLTPRAILSIAQTIAFLAIVLILAACGEDNGWRRKCVKSHTKTTVTPRIDGGSGMMGIGMDGVGVGVGGMVVANKTVCDEYRYYCVIEEKCGGKKHPLDGTGD